MKILREASEKNILLIEDDYNSEFCYYHHPSPSIQGLAGGNGVIYLGTSEEAADDSAGMTCKSVPSS